MRMKKKIREREDDKEVNEVDKEKQKRCKGEQGTKSTPALHEHTYLYLPCFIESV
jgi:hypothetical protein